MIEQQWSGTGDWAEGPSWGWNPVDFVLGESRRALGVSEDQVEYFNDWGDGFVWTPGRTWRR